MVTTGWTTLRVYSTSGDERTLQHISTLTMLTMQYYRITKGRREGGTKEQRKTGTKEQSKRQIHETWKKQRKVLVAATKTEQQRSSRCTSEKKKN